MSTDLPPREDSKHEMTRLPGADFSSVLIGMIQSIQEDPAQLRNAIYELARIKLQRMAWQHDPPLSILETRRMLLALETAIERIESNSAEQGNLPVAPPSVPLIESPLHAPHGGVTASRTVPEVETLLARLKPSERVTEALPPIEAKTRIPVPRWLWRGMSPLLRVSAIAVVVLAVTVILDRQFALFEFKLISIAPKTPVAPKMPPSIEASSSQPQHLEEQVTGALSQPAFPIPTNYGIYAISNGQLHEIEPLPGKVPDQRVFMSTPIKTPSAAVVPDGRVSFIAFRRDFTASAPDRVAVRIIAKVDRALTFTSNGPAKTVSVEDQWTIRNIAFDFRVAPLPENAEMLLIRHEDPEFLLPAGRYGLVLKGLAYDFSVAGAITEAAHCLERIEAANGSFFTECKNP